ncbi:unnamed protein product [Brassica oleracea var. botrytis]|uniref:Uncharacterized protein n=2 Tax=Brassica TaxID=3705 RepID=A0A8X7UFQ3_BRACI|nr:hypothetical protein Bca52824_059562 [Brassica carinata]CAF1727380.1 unnamed protein product [Brassica napus]
MVVSDSLAECGGESLDLVSDLVYGSGFFTFLVTSSPPSRGRFGGVRGVSGGPSLQNKACLLSMRVCLLRYCSLSMVAAAKEVFYELFLSSQSLRTDHRVLPNLPGSVLGSVLGFTMAPILWQVLVLSWL